MAHRATGPRVVHPPHGQACFFSDLGLLRSLRGQRRRHSCLVPQPLATLGSRDASRSARRKRTGCVELYELVHPLARATGADRAPSRGGGRDGLRSTDLPMGVVVENSTVREKDRTADFKGQFGCGSFIPLIRSDILGIRLRQDDGLGGMEQPGQQ